MRMRFFEYIRTPRKSLVQLDGWQIAHIQSVVGTNNTGTYRDVVELARTEIEFGGGVDTLAEMYENLQDSNRV